MLCQAVSALQIFLLAFGSGIVAGLVFGVELPLQRLLCAGLLGVVLQPAALVNVGSQLFQHSLVASTGVAAILLVVVRVANTILQTWHHQFRRG
jgi:hypothetical protein